jgi:hypothetical protein
MLTFFIGLITGGLITIVIQLFFLIRFIDKQNKNNK